MSSTAAKSRLKEAKRELYRQSLLDAAEAVFAEQGFEATKVKGVADTAGVSLATLYGVFPTKWDLLRALHRRRLEEMMADITTRAPIGAGHPVDILATGIHSYLLFHMARPNYLRLHLKEGVPWATTEVLATPEQNDAWRAGLSMMIAAIKQGQADGVFVDENPELLARTVVATHQVRLVMWVNDGMHEDPTGVSRAAIAQMIRICCQPIQVDGALARIESHFAQERAS